MTAADALTAARNILGPRARISRGADACVVARQEVLQGGTTYRRVYGRGDTWEAALAAAADSYAAMRAAPQRTA